MATDPQKLFVEALRGAKDLPAELYSQAGQVRGCEECVFDESYIDFLDNQIQLNPRGQEWTERLKRRRAGLLPFCGVRLIRGQLRVGSSDYTVRVDPTTRSVVYWEEYRE